MAEHYGFSIIRSNTFRFQDDNLDLELCCHPLTGRVTLALDGEILPLKSHFSSDFSYYICSGGNHYLLIHGRPKDQSCRYYYELCKNGEPIQRYEVKAKLTLPLCLLTLCVVMFFPVAAGEISAQYLGVSVLQWSIGTEFAVIASAVLSAIGIHIGILSYLIQIEPVNTGLADYS